MTKWMIHGLAGVISYLFLALPAHAADPALDWKTLSSDHFRIHHPKELSSQARQVADISERMYLRITEKLQWQPLDSIDVVITDEFDQANGWATPIPYTLMHLYLTPPDDAGSLEDFDDWLELLIEHELTHIIHLDKGRGIITSLRNVFGRFLLLFPNALQPGWLTEGLATYMETHEDMASGRGQSAGFDMMMRTEVQHGLMPVTQVNLPPHSWPLNKHYLYGVYFHQFIRDTYGEETITRLVHEYSNNLLPFAINTNTSMVLGKNLTILWAEFSDYLNRRFAEQLNKLNSEPLKQGTRLVDDMIISSPVRTLADGSILYIQNDYQSQAELVRLYPDGKRIVLTDVHNGARFDVLAEQGVVIAQPDFCDEFRLYYDLYIYRFEDDELEQITECGRYKWVTPNNEGTVLIAARTIDGIPQLDRLSLQDQVIETLWRGEYGDVINQIDWSSDGKQLLISRKTLHAGWGLYLLDLQSREWRTLIDGQQANIQPQFSADGNAVIYSSDHGGVYNLKKMDLNNNEVETLSHVISGAFYPSQGVEHGPINYLLYDVDGYTLHQIDEDSVNAVAIKPAPVTHVPSAEDKDIMTTSTDYTLEDYSHWPGLRPRWWLPYIVIADQANEIGFSTSSADALQNHYYDLTLGYELDQEGTIGSFFYNYSHWLTLLTSRFNSLTIDSDTTDTLRIRQHDQTQLVFTLPFTDIDQQWRFNLGFITDEYRDVYRAPNTPALFDRQDNLAGLGLYYNSSKYYLQSVSQSDGRTISLVTESSDVFDSDYSGRVTTFDWKEYLSLGGHHALAFRLLAGSGDPDTRPYQLGGIYEDFYGVAAARPDIVSVVFNKRGYALRGYPENIQVGNQLGIASLEWRFPIDVVERGIMAPPVGVMQHSGRLFTEMGSAWYDTDEADYLRSVGAEWLVDTNLFYFLTLRLRLGYAKGLDDGGTDQYYLTLGGAF